MPMPRTLNQGRNMSEENPGKDLIGNLGVIGLCFILLLPIILPILWWFGFFEESGEEGGEE